MANARRLLAAAVEALELFIDLHNRPPMELLKCIDSRGEVMRRAQAVIDEYRRQQVAVQSDADSSPR